MFIANVTDDYDNMTLSNCTNNEKNIEIIIPLFMIIPCSLSFLCLIILVIYTRIKPYIQ